MVLFELDRTGNKVTAKAKAYWRGCHLRFERKWRHFVFALHVKKSKLVFVCGYSARSPCRTTELSRGWLRVACLKARRNSRPNSPKRALGRNLYSYALGHTWVLLLLKHTYTPTNTRTHATPRSGQHPQGATPHYHRLAALFQVTPSDLLGWCSLARSPHTARSGLLDRFGPLGHRRRRRLLDAQAPCDAHARRKPSPSVRRLAARPRPPSPPPLA